MESGNAWSALKYAYGPCGVISYTLPCVFLINGQCSYVISLCRLCTPVTERVTYATWWHSLIRTYNSLLTIKQHLSYVWMRVLLLVSTNMISLDHNSLRTSTGVFAYAAKCCIRNGEAR